jgi:hypothetical protein
MVGEEVIVFENVRRVVQAKLIDWLGPLFEMTGVMKHAPRQ